MGYVVQNIHGVIAVNDEATLNEPKEIRCEMWRVFHRPKRRNPPTSI